MKDYVIEFSFECPSCAKFNVFKVTIPSSSAYHALIQFGSNSNAPGCKFCKLAATLSDVPLNIRNVSPSQ